MDNEMMHSNVESCVEKVMVAEEDQKIQPFDISAEEGFGNANINTADLERKNDASMEEKIKIKQMSENCPGLGGVKV